MIYLLSYKSYATQNDYVVYNFIYFNKVSTI
jgi:hypothetical protein